MTKHLITRALAVSLALSTLAGCGQSALLSATGAVSTDAASLQAAAQKGGKGGRMGGEKGGQKMDFYADLALTDDQKAQLQAIAETYAPAKPEGGAKPEAPGAALQALLVADTLDTEAVKAAFAAQPTPPAPGADHRVERLVAERAVLTEAQIAQIVAKLQAAPSPDANRPGPDANRPSPDANRPKPDAAALNDQLATKLGLNDEQKAALVAFQAALEANRPTPPSAAPAHADRRAAELAFWQTGDTTGLTADKPVEAARPAFPVDAFLAFASSLTVAQRQQAFAQGGIGLAFGHGGPEGRGGHEGPGGQGGHEGPGGDRGGDRPAPGAAPAAE